MMYKIKISLSSLFMIAFLAGCYYDKEEILYPNNCNTTGVTYSVTVTGILSANCYACHNTANASANGAGIQLDSYSKLKPFVDNGKLMGTINHAGGFPAMPKNATKLPACDISKIQAWVDAGAPQN
jgi:hypothetical protein